MKAVIVTPDRPGSIRLVHLDRPAPVGSEALLRVMKLGIDGTDLEINEGLYGEAPSGSDYLVAGHECFAVVEEAPENAGLVKGDFVVPTVRRPDDCYNCQNGESDMCCTGGYREHGIKGLHGFASQYSLSDSQFLVRVPGGLTDVAGFAGAYECGGEGGVPGFQDPGEVDVETAEDFGLGGGTIGPTDHSPASPEGAGCGRCGHKVP